MIVFPALIGTAFAATQNWYTTYDTKRSEIRDHIAIIWEITKTKTGGQMEEHIDDHWNEMEEHWDINSLSGRRCH